MSLDPGTRVGAYEIQALLGAGGMGEVYRARDPKLDRDVAIKMLPGAVSQDPERLTRFEREAKSLAALNHPNIAQIYAVEHSAIVMELVPGETLRGPLPLETTLDYAKQIASALEAAHEKGIIHRDLKPGNVMVTPDGVVKVLDFGLAGRAGTDATESRDLSLSPTLTVQATQAGVILGTAAYMSPEQAAGKAVDKRTDIWAFGVIVWELFTGRQMFEGETISHVLAAVLTKDSDLGVVPARVRPMLARCLEKDPKKRLRDIGDAMSLVQSGETTSAPARRRWLGVAGWGAAAVFAMALGAAIMMRPSENTEPAGPLVRFQIERNVGNPFQTDFALSPDGNRLAYYAETTTGMQLRVRALGTGESKDIAIKTVVSPAAPIWSPDGTSVLIWTASGAYVVDLSSGASRLLCNCRMRGGSWSPEGVILLGASDRERQGIKRLSLTDGTPRSVTTVDASRGETDSYPVFLPDGRHFLFTRFVDTSPVGVYVGTIDGDEPKRIADSGRVVVALITIAARSWMVSLENAGLMAQPFDLSTEAPAGQTRVVVPGTAFASISANGILATSAVGRRRGGTPTWFDRQGNAVMKIGQDAAIETVELSPDAKTLAMTYVPDQGTGRSDIWLRSVTSGADTRITFDAASDTAPVWSPDGSQLIFSSLRDGTANLFKKAANGTGSDQRLFTSDQPTWANDWSRDGKCVIYSVSTTSTDMDLAVLAIDESKPAPYLTGPGNQKQAQLSPDGRFVAYVSDESGAWEIYVQPFPNASDGKYQISNGGGLEPRWSRESDELFYLSGQKMMAVPVHSRPTFSQGVASPLFDAPIPGGYTNDGHRWQVSLDGKQFLFIAPAGDRASPIEVVVNWRSLLTK